ncbi:MAG TPA: DUF6599 family protein [Candidatus Sulfotelmatobacter sp.]|nr:DUF6599 family protein [Candidatus Sulfotelmatobacter sp.]
MLRGFASLLILTLTISVGAFCTEPIVDADANRQEMLKLLADPLPSDATTKHAASFYGPDNLYEYMDGGADIFVLYGVRTLMHADLRAKAVEVTVDVFDMGTSDTAFGIYAAERSPDFHYMTIGAEGYQYEGMLNFLQDRYYVKLLGFGDGADAVLEKLAQLLSQRIGNNPGFPKLLAKLPAENRIPHSEQYLPASPLGHAFLAPAYAVAYKADDGESKLLVTVARDKADADHRLKQLEQHFATSGQCQPAPDLGEGAIRASNSFEGSVLAGTKRQYLLLLLNPGKGGEQFMKNAAAGLE